MHAHIVSSWLVVAAPCCLLLLLMGWLFWSDDYNYPPYIARQHRRIIAAATLLLPLTYIVSPLVVAVLLLRWLCYFVPYCIRLTPGRSS